jgi:hypothetical protein
VLPVFVLSPLYSAVIEWLPFASDDVLKTAVPAELRFTVVSFLLPSLNVTEPVGAPAAPEVTVAMKVTVWFFTEGFTDEARAVEL